MNTNEFNSTYEAVVQVTDTSEILCPECNEYSKIARWVEVTVPCELCGDHYAIVCPVCEEHFDHVYAKPFIVK